MAQATAINQEITEKKRRLDDSFLGKGMSIALFSGIMYGLYSALVVAGQTQGVWAEWTAVLPATGFLLLFILPTIGTALNDLCSAIWALAITAKQGKMGDFFKSLRSKPGVIMVVAAVVGGPIAGVAYVMALVMAGAIVTPVAALNSAIGAILARILYKQKLGARTICGILICVAASIMIGMTSLTGEASAGMLPGIALAFLAALGWGIEGCIAGYGTSMIDCQVGITIRQTVSSLVNLVCVLPLLTIVGGIDLSVSYQMLGAALTDISSILFFAASGLFAYLSFSRWYQGNSMCGTALGMACNGTYAFWSPLATWIIVGLYMGLEGYGVPPIAWVAALVMVVGVTIIAVNPLEFFKKDAEAPAMPETLPLNYAMLKYFTTVDEASVEEVMDALKGTYASHRAFTRDGMTDSIMTAEKNGLLEEARTTLDAHGDLLIYYRATAEQKQTINSYIK